MVVKRISIYLFAILAAVVLISKIFWHGIYLKKEDSRQYGDLFNKAKYYRSHSDQFDLIFLGDSRTYCAMHPDLIDPLLGTHSFNLSYWSNWFPTQRALLNDIVDDIPKNTHVVWSFGHQNFINFHINEIYPFSMSEAVSLIRSGNNLSEIISSQIYFSSWLQFLSVRDKIYEKLMEVMDIQINSSTSKQIYSNLSYLNKQTVSPKAQDVQNIGITKYWYGDNEIVSVEHRKANGAYLRTELSPEFYRNKQFSYRESILQSEKQVFQLSDSEWQVFVDILTILEKSGLQVTMNVFEEAPHTYVDEDYLHEVRSFIDEKVRQEVESRGFKMIYVDFDQLADEHYFDYNHLNARGVEKYTTLFAEHLGLL